MPKISELTDISTISGLGANETLPLVQSGTTKSATLKSLRGGTLSILDFIPKSQHAAIAAGTSTYDCSSALAAAIAAVSMPGLGLLILTGGPEIYFPPGQYSFASTQHIKKRVRLRGVYGASAGAWGTVLKFPADVGGFVFHKENTDSTGTVPATQGADGSIMEGFNIYGTSRTGVNPNAHGIWLRARVTLKDVEVGTFHGNGIHIEATAGGGGFVEGNANNFQILQCAGRVSGGHGLYVHGADANAGVVIGFNGDQNLGYGIYDSSFLGNTYIGCHTADNATGSYKSDNANARNIFIGCYAELGQPAGNIMSPAITIGGLQGPGWDAASTGKRLDVDSNGLTMKGNVAIDHLRLGLDATTGVTDGVLYRYLSTDDLADWTFVRATGRIAYQWANAGVPAFFYFYDRLATPANGYARDLSAGNGAIGIGPHYFGTHTEMKLRDLGATAPATGTNLQGDFRWHSAPATTTFLGWTCTTGGTPGTWEPAGEVIGIGGTVTQITNKTTGVTLNARAGQITMEPTGSIAAGAVASFTLTNSKITATDVVHIQRKSGGTAASYRVWCDSVAAGSCVICVENRTGGALAEALVLQFRALMSPNS